ncbi:MAG: mechanosensitive ion channel family protein [Calditrichia bacterium]
MDVVAPFQLLQKKLEAWLGTIISMLPNLVLAVLVFIFFMAASRIIKKVAMNLLDRFSSSGAINRLIASLLSITTLIIGFFVILGILQLNKTVTSLLAGAGIIGLALSFAFQDIAQNFISGVLIAIRKPFDVGDIIKTNDYMGMVDKITLRSTDILTFDGQFVLIPNKEVFQNPIINYSETGLRRIDLSVGISYGDDLEKVKRITLEAVRKVANLETNRAVDFYYEEFGNSSINYVVRFWIRFKKQTDYLQARSDAIMNIKAAYNANNITIPFPIRTLDFGIKGGEKLTEMYPVVTSADKGGNDKSEEQSS